LERSTHGVDKDGDLAMEDGRLESFRKLWNGMVCGGVIDDWGQDRAELCEETKY